MTCRVAPDSGVIRTGFLHCDGRATTTVPAGRRQSFVRRSWTRSATAASRNPVHEPSPQRPDPRALRVDRARHALLDGLDAQRAGDFLVVLDLLRPVEVEPRPTQG